RRSLPVYALNIVTFYRENLGHDRVEVAPSRLRENYLVERKQKRGSLLDATRFLKFVDASLDHRTRDLLRSEDLRRELIALLIALRVERLLKLEYQLRITRDDDHRVVGVMSVVDLLN